MPIRVKENPLPKLGLDSVTTNIRHGYQDKVIIILLYLLLAKINGWFTN